MKKTSRILLFVLSVIVICFVFTGCDELDQMKLSYATLDGDNIILNGDTYIPIPAEKVENRPEFNTDFAEDIPINACEPDVPLLLSDSFYTYSGYITKDKTVIRIYEYESREYADITTYYCREDKYDSLLEKLDEEFSVQKQVYSYTYYDYDKLGYISGIYTLTEEQETAVDKIIATVKPNEDSDYYNSFYPDSYVEIYGCSDDLLFCMPSYTIAYSYGSYSVILETSSEIKVFDVPSEYNLTFSEIMAQQFISDGIYTEFDEDVL